MTNTKTSTRSTIDLTIGNAHVVAYPKASSRLCSYAFSVEDTFDEIDYYGLITPANLYGVIRALRSGKRIEDAVLGY